MGFSGTGTIAKQVGYYWFNHQTKLVCDPFEIKSSYELWRTLIITKVNKLYLYFQLVRFHLLPLLSGFAATLVSMTIIAHVPCEFQSPNPSKFYPLTAIKQYQIFLRLGLVVRITRTPSLQSFLEDATPLSGQHQYFLSVVVSQNAEADPTHQSKYQEDLTLFSCRQWVKCGGVRGLKLTGDSQNITI